MDREDIRLIKAALEEADRVDAGRIEVAADGDVVVLKGSVAEPEEAHAAEVVAGTYAPKIENQLRVDRNLREGAADPVDTEQVVPAEGEVLVGSTDMLAGPESEITSDTTQAFQENEPWDPPTEPSLAPTVAEQRGEGFGDGGATDSSDPEEPDNRGAMSAPDLTQQDLENAARGGTVPSLDPDRVAESPLAQQDPFGVEELGEEPEPLDDFPPQVPGTAAGLGGVGEGTAGGGSISGVPATETGSVGGDTAAADPARSNTGGTGLGTGTQRGPDSPDDRALREDFPEAEPEEH